MKPKAAFHGPDLCGDEGCKLCYPDTEMSVPTPDKLGEEIERQRAIYRPGTAESTLQRAAVRALIDKGER